MSDGGKPIELQVLSSPQDGMSASGSFGPPSSHTGDTDVGALGPLYQSINETKSSHGKYQAKQVPPKEHNQTPGPTSEPNEYDFINEKQVKGPQRGGSQVGGPHPPQMQLVSENALYADQATAADYRHKTLTLEKQQSRFSGSLTSPVREPEIKYGEGSRCKLRYVWIAFFILVSILMALAALVVVVIIVIGVYELPCECDSATDSGTLPSTDTSELTRRISELEAMVVSLNGSLSGQIVPLNGQVATLNTMLATQQNNSTANDDMINERIDAVSEQVGNLSLDVDANTEEIARLNETDPLVDAAFDATFNVNVYDPCTVTKLASCVVPLRTDSVVSPCDTGGNNPYNVTGQYTVDAYCARTDQNSASNAIVTTLQVVDGLMFCQCYVVSPNIADSPQNSTIDCSLFVVRCPISQSISTTIRT